MYFSIISTGLIKQFTHSLADMLLMIYHGLLSEGQAFIQGDVFQRLTPRSLSPAFLELSHTEGTS